MSFFDLDDILSSHQRIQCTFKKPLPKLGFFDPNSKSDAIEQGAKIDLPLWLVKELRKNNRSIVSIEIPKSYGTVCRAILDADAYVVDLHKLGPFFYAAGIDLMLLGTEEASDLGKMLIQAFTGRFRWIMDKGMNSAGEEKPQLMERAELKLYTTAQRSAKFYIRWLSRESELLSTPEVASTVQKKLKM